MDPAILYSIARRRDSRHGTATLQFHVWQGAPALWRIGVLREDGTLDSMTGVSGIRLLVSTYGGTRPGTDSWIDRSVAAADFTVPASAQAVRDGTGWHAQFSFAEGELQLPVDVSGERVYWYEFRTAEGIVLAAGEMVVRARTGVPVERYVTPGDVAAAVAAEAVLRTEADTALAGNISALSGTVGTQGGAIAALQTASASQAGAITELQAEQSEQSGEIAGLMESANAHAAALEALEEGFDGLANSATITASATPAPGQIPLVGGDGKIPASILPPSFPGAVMSLTTSGATPAKMTVDGAPGLEVAPHTALQVSAWITARSDGGARAKMWTLSAGIKCGTGAASAVLVGTPESDVSAEDTGTEAWGIGVSAVPGDEDTPARLAVTATGETGKTIMWSAVCMVSAATGTATDDDGTGNATIYGVPAAGAVLTRSGDFGYLFDGEDWPGYPKGSVPNDEWKINGAGTGSHDPEFTVPGGLSSGTQIRCGNSNILTVP